MLSIKRDLTDGLSPLVSFRHEGHSGLVTLSHHLLDMLFNTVPRVEQY